MLRRSAEWVSPTGRLVRVRSTRLVSFTQRAIAAIEYEVEAVEDDLPVVVRSELIANESLPSADGDPRAAAALAAPLQSEFFAATDTRSLLVHSTKGSGLRVGAAMGHVVDGPSGTETTQKAFDFESHFTVTADIGPGKPLRLIKFIAYGWSSERSYVTDATRGFPSC